MGRALTRGVVAVVGVSGVVIAGVAWAGRQSPVPAQPTPTPAAVETTPVTRTDVAQRERVTGTLGFEGTHTASVVGEGGVVTSLPAVGATLTRGDTVYELSGRRVKLMYGKRPAWRTLSWGVTGGLDVLQLERNLKAMGHGDDLTVDRRFSEATYWAVRRWQDAANLPVTGRVELGQVAFLPGPMRVAAHLADAGAPVGNGVKVVRFTGTARVINVDLQPTVAPRIKVGDRVSVTLPDGKRENGRVTRVSRVAVTSTAQGSATSVIPVTVKLTTKKPPQGLDQAQVQVAITSQVHRKVLAVPIPSLVARAGGTYEVVVAEGGSRRNIQVTTGLFDEITGLVEVSGPGLAEGMAVEVPPQ
ncbi:peptidoglycan-binding protein [Nonomuraea sp. NBC_00507]|uniref:peptidoglycan-binding domain-containing protein n=1 Tax=Nonomuraea sp. NBC_00507 TaxID=2976002 RepID=UPI002E17F24C